jgi:hypothetical protein
MGLPSDTTGVALSVTGVDSFTSVTSVDTAVLFGSSCSKLPPVTLSMPLRTGAWPWTTSLLARVCTVPLVCPTGISMVSPLFSLTNSGVPVTAVGTVAV